MQVTKIASHIPVSCCVLTDATGENLCTHPPPPAVKVSLRSRLRNRWRDARESIARWVAGPAWPNEDE